MPEKRKNSSPEAGESSASGLGAQTRSRARHSEAAEDLQTIPEDIVVMNPPHLDDDVSDVGDLQRARAQEAAIHHDVQACRDAGAVTGDISDEIKYLRTQHSTKFAQLQANLNNQEDEITTQQANLTSHQEMYFKYVAGNDQWRQELTNRLAQKDEEIRRLESQFAQQLRSKDEVICQLHETVDKNNHDMETFKADFEQFKVEMLQGHHRMHENHQTQIQHILDTFETRMNTATQAAAQAAAREATEAVVQAAAHGVPAAQAGSVLTADEVAEIRRERQANRDRYYINTLSIKKFNPDRIDQDQSNRQKALAILKIDNLESLMDKAILVVVTERALRLTYSDSHIMKESLGRIGSVANMLKRQDRDLQLSYSQLTPPRMELHRFALLQKAKILKNNNEIMSFHFVLVRGALMVKANVRNKTASVLSLPADWTPAPADEDSTQPMETNDGEPPSPEYDRLYDCVLCREVMEGGCYRLPCGHGYHLSCLKLAFSIGKIWCPVCRAYPEDILTPVISERLPNCQVCTDNTDHLQGIERMDTMRLSPKCGHLHSISCHFAYSPTKWQDGYWTEETVRAARDEAWPGCVSCAAGHERYNPSWYDIIVECTTNSNSYVAPGTVPTTPVRRPVALPDNLVTVVRARTLEPRPSRPRNQNRTSDLRSGDRRSQSTRRHQSARRTGDRDNGQQDGARRSQSSRRQRDRRDDGRDRHVGSQDIRDRRTSGASRHGRRSPDRSRDRTNTGGRRSPDRSRERNNRVGR